MAESLGTLRINVVAGTKEFTSKMEKVTDKVKEVTSVAKKLPGKLGKIAQFTELILKYGVQVLAIFTAISTAVALIVRQSMKWGAELGKVALTAKQLAVTFNQLETFRLFGEEAGVSGEGLIKQLKEFQRTFAGQRMGVVPGQDVADSFRRIVATIERMPRSYERIQLAQAALGGEWRQIMREAKASGGIAAFAEQLRKTGQALNPAQVAVVDRYRKAMKELTASWAGMWKQISVRVLPAITHVVKFISWLIQKLTWLLRFTIPDARGPQQAQRGRNLAPQRGMTAPSLVSTGANQLVFQPAFKG